VLAELAGQGAWAVSAELAGQGASAAQVVPHSGLLEEARALPVRNVRAAGSVI